MVNNTPPWHNLSCSPLISRLTNGCFAGNSIGLRKDELSKRSAIFVLTTMIPRSSKYPYTDPNDTAFLSGNASD
ncbi:hypothetical protein M513_04981 [Trichuris suis]|uniref:Uncharacterized protein n=1 Tax=Trichuris suis TaxID=68888 RepID=A0A085MAF8_9BILA|nr:hypothetical protein M513_04981 [Trichuris suis]